MKKSFSFSLDEMPPCNTEIIGRKAKLILKAYLERTDQLQVISVDLKDIRLLGRILLLCHGMWERIFRP